RRFRPVPRRAASRRAAGRRRVPRLPSGSCPAFGLKTAHSPDRIVRPTAGTAVFFFRTPAAIRPPRDGLPRNGGVSAGDSENAHGNVSDGHVGCWMDGNDGRVVT